jgi:uncharacterized surface protein with fasciclin (FAS1) repeats
MDYRKIIALIGIVALLFAAATGVAGCTSEEEAAEEAVEEEMEEEEAAEEAVEEEMEEEMDTIVDIAAADPQFSTLVTALTEAGLVETLSGGEYTVFAPTDEAFAALPEGTLDELLADPEGQLTDVLTYHVVEGTVMAADVVELDGQEVATVNGATVLITVGDDGSVMVNDANVIVTDIEASNGVIHVIDAVLIP